MPVDSTLIQSNAQAGLDKEMQIDTATIGYWIISMAPATPFL